jgi:DnaJ family protein C protein 28
MNWDRLVEQKIRAAQDEGKFDNLPGQGHPLKLDENPFEDPAWRMAHHLLKENGFRPEWIEADVELRAQWEQARLALIRSHDWRAAQLADCAGRSDPAAIQRHVLVAQEWKRALARFREAAAAINKGLARLNLLVPSPRFQRRMLDADVEAQTITSP